MKCLARSFWNNYPQLMYEDSYALLDQRSLSPQRGIILAELALDLGQLIL